MPQNSKTSTDAATDFEAVSRQIDALRADLSHLVETVGGIAGRRSNHMASDISEGFGEAKHYVAQTGKSAEHQLEASVVDHPLLAIGLAAGAGLLVGAMSRR
ncbi:DUF883 family protein [Planktotalea arctica]|uniref:DUF883 family protein n=1 Tax=Planktotalea arctica TaxID=1481893 RepID=UPI00321B398A